MISLSNGLLSLNGGGLEPPTERRRSQETVSLNGGVHTPPLSDGSLKAWAGSGLGLGQVFFCIPLHPPLSAGWAWSTRRPKADIKGGVGGEAPHESGRPKADGKGGCGGEAPPRKRFPELPPGVVRTTPSGNLNYPRG